LTKARAQMVNRRTLATEAKRMQLGQYLILSRGEESNGGRERPSSLADALEAVLGAVYLDGGFEAATSVILHCFKDAFGELTEIPSLINPKGELQELLQAGSTEAPVYQMTSVEGPDHDRVFECAVFHGGQELARGQGKSKKLAESHAAFAALEILRSKKSNTVRAESARQTFTVDPLPDEADPVD
jgi:ribonuclease-3